MLAFLLLVCTLLVCLNFLSFFTLADGMPIFVDDSWSKLVLRESDGPDIHKVAAEMLYGDNEQSIHLAYLPTAVSLL